MAIHTFKVDPSIAAGQQDLLVDVRAMDDPHAPLDLEHLREWCMWIVEDVINNRSSREALLEECVDIRIYHEQSGVEVLSTI